MNKKKKESSNKKKKPAAQKKSKKSKKSKIKSNLGGKIKSGVAGKNKSNIANAGKNKSNIANAGKVKSNLGKGRIKSNTGNESKINIKKAYDELQKDTTCKSMLKRFLTKDLFDKLLPRKTKMGSKLIDVIQSGLVNHDSSIGIYAPDPEAYIVFAELFNKIIEEYHGFKPTDEHPPSDYGNTQELIDLDPENKFIVSTRVRCGRSVKDFPLNPCLKEKQYKDLEQKISGILAKIPDEELKGTYYPLMNMSKEEQKKLIDDHFLFKEGDRFLQAANACRYWPVGRGIFMNKAKTFLVWVNEEDHIRIISMQQGGNLKEIYERMIKGVKYLESNIEFVRDNRLGFLTFCPTNLGTTIRASVMIKLPKLASNKAQFEAEAEKMNLQIRGSKGEHTDADDGMYDVSNKRRLGLTEFQAVMEMQKGVLSLIEQEKSLSKT